MPLSTEQIQVFYEIAQSMGKSFELEPMLKMALSTILRKLNCSAAVVMQMPCHKNGVDSCIFSVPRTILKNPAFLHAQKKIAGVQDWQELKKEMPITVEVEKDIHYYLFELSDYGILFIGKYGARLEMEIISEMTSIVEQLATSIDACNQSKKLHTIENRFREMADFLPNSLLEIDTECNILFANKRLWEKFGVNSGLLHSKISKFIPQEYMEQIYAYLQKTFSGDSPGGFELEVTLPTQKRIPVLAYTSPLIQDEEITGARVILVDISQRKEYEDNLRLKDKALNNAAIGILITNAKGIAVWTNPAFLELTGKDFVQVIHQPADFYISDGTVLHQQMLQKISQGHPFKGEFKRIRKDGSIYFEELSITPMKDEKNKEIEYYIAFFQDITNRRKTEELLLFRESLENLIMNISADSLNMQAEEIENGINFTLKKIGQFTNVDRSFAYLFENTCASLTLKNEWHIPSVKPLAESLKLLHIKDAQHVFADMLRKKNVRIHHTDEYKNKAFRTVLQKQGIHSLLLVPINYLGKAIGMLGLANIDDEKVWSEDILLLLNVVGEVVANLLERKRIEQALKTSDETARALLNAPTDPAMLLDNRGMIINLNQAAGYYLQDEPDALINKNLFHMLKEKADLDWQPESKLLKTIFRGKPYWVEGTMQGRWFKHSIYPIFENGKLYRIAVFSNDITDQKRIEESLRESDRLKSMFVSNVSHELRTPLASIFGFSHTILNDPSMPNDVQREFIKIIYEESERLKHLIEDILNLSNIETGSTKYDMQQVNTKELLEGISTTGHLLAQKKNQIFKIEIPADLHNIHADFDAVKQVMMNLVNNAVKFTPVHGTIRISASNEQEFVLIKVKDTGLGIPAKDLPHIFEKFYRVYRKGMEIEGTGLGLPITKEIVESHQGQIDVESKENSGTTFTLWLPSYNN